MPFNCGPCSYLQSKILYWGRVPKPREFSSTTSVRVHRSAQACIFQLSRMKQLPVLDYSFRWAEIVIGLKFEKSICWLCSPDCINLCQNLISCLEHFPFKSFRQELSNINLQVYLRRAHNAYFRTGYVACPFFGKISLNFIWDQGFANRLVHLDLILTCFHWPWAGLKHYSEIL